MPRVTRILQSKFRAFYSTPDEENNVVQSILYSGADPKSVVCAFFKQGQCSKGDKCKFSHNIALDRKGEKRSIYVDARDADEDLKNGKHC